MERTALFGMHKCCKHFLWRAFVKIACGKVVTCFKDLNVEEVDFRLEKGNDNYY